MTTTTGREELVVMKTKLDATMIKLDDLVNKIDRFIDTADTKYASREQVLDQEKRIRVNEKMLWLGLGGLAVLQLLLAYFL